MGAAWGTSNPWAALLRPAECGPSHIRSRVRPSKPSPPCPCPGTSLPFSLSLPPRDAHPSAVGSSAPGKNPRTPYERWIQSSLSTSGLPLAGWQAGHRLSLPRWSSQATPDHEATCWLYPGISGARACTVPTGFSLHSRPHLPFAAEASLAPTLTPVPCWAQVISQPSPAPFPPSVPPKVQAHRTHWPCPVQGTQSHCGR